MILREDKQTGEMLNITFDQAFEELNNYTIDTLDTLRNYLENGYMLQNYNYTYKLDRTNQ